MPGSQRENEKGKLFLKPVVRAASVARMFQKSHLKNVRVVRLLRFRIKLAQFGN